MKKSLLKIISIFFSCLFVLSCSNLISGDNSGAGYNSFEKVNISGTIGVKGAVPSSIANARSLSAAINGRTAIPTIPEGADYYFFKTRDLDSGEVDNAAGSADSNGYYSVGLIIGRRFEVTAGISSDLEHENVIFSTSWETPVVTRENAASLGKNIILAPESESEGEGTVKLSMTVASSINSVSCDNSLFTVSGSGTSYTVENTGTKIRCGAHSLTFTFLDESGHLLFYNTQIINVFPNMETNKWVSGGGSLDPIDADGNYNVTTTLIEKFARSQIYVGTTSYGTAGSGGNGSSKAPFVSLQNAVSYITRMNDSSIDYTIWISGEVSGNSTIDSDVDGKAHSITICGTKGNAYDSLNGKNSGTVLSISTSVPVTIKDLKITKGYAASGSGGGGINMTGGAKVTLESGALIGDETEAPATSSSYGNKSGTSGGGGIYISNGTLIMKKGSRVSHNYDGTSNYSGNGGGGIYCNDGNITVEKGAVVSYNATTSRGGGIKLDSASGKSVNLSINGGEICNNDAVGWGGGLFSSGNGNNEIKMTSGKLSGNKSSGTNAGQGPGGGAVFMDSGKFTMSGDSEISENTAKRDGGGILLKGAGCEVNLLGGIIKDNNIDGDGTGAGAVKVNSTAGTLNIGGSIQIPYGCQGTKGIGKNEIFLENGKFITVTENITSPSPVATIRVQTWNRGSSAIVVKADGTNVNDLSTISDITNMFVCSEEKYFTVLSDDKKSLYLDAPIYVSKTVTNAAASKGTKANPYDSIASAISAEMNDSNTDYLIYVVGELTEKQTIAGTFKKDSHAKSLTIKGYDDTAVLKGGSDISSSVLSVLSDVPVTIMNLKITGGKESGIKVGKVEADVTLGNGAKITDNASSGNGGGIYNSGTLTILSGAEISNNRSYASGGGIYNYFGNVIMEGGSISGNTADSSGGGIYNYKQGSTVPRVTTFEMKGGTVSENTATYGGAVYNEGAVKLSGSAYIPAGTDDNNVVYLAGDTKILITGSLTPPEEAKGTVATIKLAEGVTEGRIVLDASTELLSNSCSKFELYDEDWIIGKDGKCYSTIITSLSYSLQEVFKQIPSDSSKPIKIRLESDIDVPYPTHFEINYPLVIEGNHKISSGYDKALFTVNEGGKLTVKEGVEVNYTGSDEAAIKIDKGEVNIQGSVSSPVKITATGYNPSGILINEGILNAKNLTISASNRTPLTINGGSVTIENMTISNNLMNTNGGGIKVSGGTSTLTNCNISENKLSASGGSNYFGGGIYMSSGTLTLDKCTINNNIAAYYSTNSATHGGGIYAKNGSRITISNDTIISGNGVETGGSIEGKQYYFEAGVIYNNRTLTEVEYQD